MYLYIGSMKLEKSLGMNNYTIKSIFRDVCMVCNALYVKLEYHFLLEYAVLGFHYT